MIKTLRDWLNGSREYFSGVAIYEKVGNNAKLIEVLKKGPNDFRVSRLQAELITICETLKEKSSYENLSDHPVRDDIPVTDPPIGTGHPKHANNKPAAKEIPADQPGNPEPVNEELYLACKAEADQAYKKVMNTRAVLFDLAPLNDFVDVNKPDRVFGRAKLALDVVSGWKEMSALYDRANYVKATGRLPHIEAVTESEYDHTPDHLIKKSLDNCRKALNKLKHREQTPERIVLMQKHQANILKLEEKWRLLNQ